MSVNASLNAGGNDKNKIFKDNKLLDRLRPSKLNSKIKNSFLKLFNRVFTSVNNPFQFVKPLIVRSGIRLRRLLPIEFDSMNEYYKKLLKNERAILPSTFRSLQNLQLRERSVFKIKGYEQTISILEAKIEGKHGKKNASLKRKLDGLKNDYKMRIKKFAIHEIEQCKHLKSGEMKIVRTLSNPVRYFILTKEDGKINLEVIDSSKNEKSIRYKGIPIGNGSLEEPLAQILTCEMSIEKNDVFNSIEKFKTNDGRKISQKTDQLFWDVVGCLVSKDDTSKFEKKRLKLKADLLQLFEEFRSWKLNPEANADDFQKIETLKTLISHQILLAFKREEISKLELNEVLTELKVIDDALFQSKRPISNQIPTKVSRPKKLIPGIRLKDFNAAVPHEIGTIQPVQMHDKVREPKPLTSFKIDASFKISTNPFQEIKSVQQFLDTFNTLYNSWEFAETGMKKEGAREELIHFFKYVPFDFTSRNSKLDQSQPGKYVEKFSAKEAEALLSQIAKFAQNALPMSEKMNVTQLHFEVMVRLQWISRFLTYKSCGYFFFPYGRNYKTSILERKFVNSEDVLKYSNEYMGKVFSSDFKSATIDDNNFNDFLTPEFVYSDKDLSRHVRVLLEMDSGKENAIRIPAHKVIPLIKISAEIEKSLGIEAPREFYDSIYKIEQVYSNPSWLREIEDPFLLALYSLTLMDPDYKDRVSGNDDLNRNVPEAFHHDPHALIQFYFNQLSGAHPEFVEGLLNNCEFQPNEIKALSRLLGYTRRDVELAAFLIENPALMQKRAVRHFFEALLFCSRRDQANDPSWDGNFTWGRATEHPLIWHDSDEVISALKKSVDRLKDALKDDFNSQSLRDGDLTASRIDELLFYLDLDRKFQKTVITRTEMMQILDWLDDKGSKFPELKESLGMIPRIKMRYLLENDNITEENLGDILNQYALIVASPVESKLLDPHFEELLRGRIYTLMRKLEEFSDLLPVDRVQGILDQLCSAKNLPLDCSEWKMEKPLIYQNSMYKIDLRYFHVSRIGEAERFDRLPFEILNNPKFNKIFPQKWLANQTVVITEIPEGRAYSLLDSCGNEVRFEIKQGSSALYRKLGQPDPKWRLHVSSRLLDTQNLSAKNNKASQKSSAVLSSFFENNLYVDPSEPSKGFIINAAGSIDFEVQFKDTKKGVIVKGVYDLRGEKKSNLLQVSSAHEVKEKMFGCLKSFENLNEILLFSQKGQLKQVELNRYGLLFEVDQGRLICKTDPFKGYIVDQEATTKEKQGIAHALLLTHPNPKQPKKLLIPQAKNIKIVKRKQKALARGLGKIVRRLKGNKNLATIEEILDPLPRHLEFRAFNLRPITGEVCVTSLHEKQACLDLVEAALVVNDPFTAKKMIQKIDVTIDLLTPPFSLKLFKFLSGTHGAFEGAEASLKLEICCKLIEILKENKKYSGNFKFQLEGLVKKLSNTYYSEENEVPSELVLSTEHKNRIDHIIKRTESASQAKSELAKNLLPVMDRADKIKQLESELSIHVKLDPNDLNFLIPKLPHAEQILFTSQEVEALFEESQKEEMNVTLVRPKDLKPYEEKAFDEVEENLRAFKEDRQFILKQNGKKALRSFLKRKLLPLRTKKMQEVEKLKEEIEFLARCSDDLEKQLNLFANPSSIMDFEAVRLAFIRDELQEPLKEKVALYYDSLSRINAAEAAVKLVSEIIATSDPKDVEKWAIQSMRLHQLLTLSRQYDYKQEPRLLVFEAQTMINFKKMDGGFDQLDLLAQLIETSNSLVQAPTGSGKTSVLSVLRCLLKANGKNLVIQKVLPPLFNQTLEQLEETLVGLHKQLVYPFRFNLKMKMTTEEIYRVRDKRGIKRERKKEVSIFKGIYCDMLEMIKNKGCILTDYKSLPLLEEKFFKLGQDLLEIDIAGRRPSKLQVEHYTYLRKILLLLEAKADENMDEFDIPNRNNQKIQIDMGTGKVPISADKIETVVEIYQILMEDPSLGLEKNIQKDLSKETRDNSILVAAKAMAERIAGNDRDFCEGLHAYFLGKSDAVLEQVKDHPKCDQIALCKDQFLIYLPLCLEKKRGSDYGRTHNGLQTQPWRNGEPQEAQFGTFLERMNYTIQDYLHAGITEVDLMKWFNPLKQIWQVEQNPQLRGVCKEQIKSVFKNRNIDEVISLSKTSEGRSELIAEINRDSKLIFKFVRERLNEMNTNGYVISMDPQMIIEMNRAVSGVSATMGASEALHPQFVFNRDVRSKIQAGMIRRIFKRAKTMEVTAYDPENPQEMLKGANAQAVIDGAGAFTEGAKQNAEALLKSHGGLKQVGFHGADKEIAFVGEQTSNLNETGFYFAQAQTRGTDITLSPHAHAVLTLSNKDGLRDYCQKEGRLRNEEQTYQLAISKHQKIKTLDEAVANCISVDSELDAKEIFRACKQRPMAILRKAMKMKLLNCEAISDFIEQFKNPLCKSLFITDPEFSLHEKGAYFKARAKLQNEEVSPNIALNEIRERALTVAKTLNLDEAEEQIRKISYSEELLQKMPPLVAPFDAEQIELGIELQVEQEQEQEIEQEIGLELDLEEEKPVIGEAALYPRRMFTSKANRNFSRTELIHSVQEKIHPAYDPLIRVTDNFLPFSRDSTGSQFKRSQFDNKMYKIGKVYYVKNKGNEPGIFVLEDPLHDESMRNIQAIYDIRLNRWIDADKRSPNLNAQEQENFVRCISQIKFLDGRMKGYSEEELEVLKNWLINNDPNKMREHFMGEILKYRQNDRMFFEKSQLGQLFKYLCEEKS